jgi:predicted acetylornithine/succinylornithine family transaminase
MSNMQRIRGSKEQGRSIAEEAQAQAWDADHVMTTYARFPVTFVRGEGAYLFDPQGRHYLDFLSGIAVCAVGHAHPYLTRALQEQAATLLHVSNLYLTEPQARLARRLVELSDFERVFFCNSGAEANEAALKLARKHGRKHGRATRESKTGVVTALNSFHGRTIATVTATGQPKYSKDFAPLPAGFQYVPFNDVEALRAAVNDETAAILLEPIQGEGGVKPATPDYLRAARELADRHGALLIFDEVQTGVGRTGSLWAYQRYGVVPDVMTLAKGLGGGVPIGACLARGTAAETLKPGDHGSTFAGNPLAATAANAVLDILADEGLTQNARTVGAHLASELTALRDRFPGVVGGVRGMGLMLGVEMLRPVAKLAVRKALEVGLVANATGDDTIRLLPPLTLTAEQATEGVRLLGEAIGKAVEEDEATAAAAATPG